MHHQLSNDEIEQLIRIEHDLRNNKRVPHDGEKLASLIVKGLIVPNGMSYSFTVQGREALKSIRDKH